MRKIIINNLEYEVNDEDLILKRRGRGYRKSFPDKDGYLKYTFGDGSSKTFNITVHKFVWQLYNGDVPKGLTIDHVDGNKQNNHISNLRLLSARENVIKGNARYWLISDPDNIMHKVYNLTQFCRLNQLHQGHLSATIGNANSFHKGWKCHERY